MFDIRRTFREAYDQARRVLFTLENTLEIEDSESGDEDLESDDADLPTDDCLVCDTVPACDRCKAKQCTVSTSNRNEAFHNEQ